MTVGKGIGGGFPLAAVVSTDELTTRRALREPLGQLAPRYGGNPLASAAGLAALEIIVTRTWSRTPSASARTMLARLQAHAGEAPHHRRRARQGPAARPRARQGPRARRSSSRRISRRPSSRSACAAASGDVYIPIIRLNPPLTSRDAALEGLDILDEALGVVAREWKLEYCQIDEVNAAAEAPRGRQAEDASATEADRRRRRRSVPTDRPHTGRVRGPSAASRMTGDVLKGASHRRRQRRRPRPPARLEGERPGRHRRGRRRPARAARGSGGEPSRRPGGTTPPRIFSRPRSSTSSTSARRPTRTRLLVRAGARALAPRALREAAGASPDELRGLPAARGREGTDALHRAQLEARSPAREDRGAAWRSGAVGEVRRVRWETLRDKPAAAVGEAGNWRVDPAQSGGGILFDHGWHALYVVAQWLPARRARSPRNLEIRKHKDFPIEDTADLFSRLPVGLRRDLPDLGGRPSAPTASRSWGTRGRLTADGGRWRSATPRARGCSRRGTSRRWPRARTTPTGSAGVIADFLGEIAEPRTRGRNLAEASFCANVLALARESSRLGGEPLPIERVIPGAGGERGRRLWRSSPRRSPSAIAPETVLLGLPMIRRTVLAARGRALRASSSSARRRALATAAGGNSRGARGRGARGRDAPGLERGRHGKGPEESRCRAARRPGTAVATRADLAPARKRLLQDLVKDTEGFMSRHVERKVSLAVSRLLAGTRITPNAMTLVSVAVGLAGAPFFLSRGRLATDGRSAPLPAALDPGRLRRRARAPEVPGVALRRRARLLGRQRRPHRGLRRDGRGMEPRRRRHVAAALRRSRPSPGRSPRRFFVYLRTMTGKKEGPSTRPSRCTGETTVTRIADALSRRDFIYLVLILSLSARRTGSSRWRPSPRRSISSRSSASRGASGGSQGAFHERSHVVLPGAGAEDRARHGQARGAAARAGRRLDDADRRRPPDPQGPRAAHRLRHADAEAAPRQALPAALRR